MHKGANHTLQWSNKRRRGTAKASLTKLATKVTELEDADPDPSVASRAQQYLKRLETLDANFKTHHLAIMDAVDEEGQLEAEQEVLDQHDDDIMNLSMRLQAMSAPARPTPTPPETPPLSDRTVVERHLAQLQTRLAAAKEDISGLVGSPSDVHLVYLYQEQLSDFKRELSELRSEVLGIAADTSDPLCGTIQMQDREIFDMSVKVKKLFYNPGPASDSSGTLTPEPHGVKLPKIDVPMFNGNLLHWQTFWEQFSIAVDGRSDLSTTEKLVYLRHSLKDGSGKTMIKGLSHTGDQYKEAIASLKARYARPHLIHQAHVRKIYELANLKEGSGKELRQLHDTVQQHLRALKAMGHEPSGSFITSLLELKLDTNTMFEWQKASQDSADVPHYAKLLEFFNLCAQASETCSGDTKKIPRDLKKPNQRGVTSFTASTGDGIPNCTLCKTQVHPLYVCPQFKSLPHDKMLTVIRSNNLCLNCLKPGHISKSCGSNNRCRRCQTPHHTLLHSEAKTPNSSKEQAPPVGEQRHSSTLAVAPLITSNTQPGSSGKSLLMTCQLLVNAPDGSCPHLCCVFADSGVLRQILFKTVASGEYSFDLSSCT